MMIPSIGQMIPVIRQSPLKVNLVSCWEFDESSGTTFYDSFGSKNLTMSSSSMGQGTAKTGAYSSDLGAFNASNSSFSGINGDFFIGVWLYVNSSTAAPEETLVSFGSSSYNATINIQGDGDGNAFKIIVRGATGSIDSGFVYSFNTWYYIIFRRVASSGMMYMSVNNGSESSAQDYASWTPNFTSVTVSSHTYYTGYVDQLAIWKQALSSDEKSQLYNSGNGLAYTNW